MAHVIIIGASTGGMPAAYEIKNALGRDHKVTVVSNTPLFHFVPSNPWVAVGWRSRKETAFEIQPYLSRKKIDFIASAVTKIDPDQNQISLENGQTLDYDYLVIATGPKLAFEEVEGLGPAGHTQSVCTLNHAESAYEAWQKFVEDPGPAFYPVAFILKATPWLLAGLLLSITYSVFRIPSVSSFTQHATRTTQS